MARPVARRTLHRNRAAREVVAAGREPGVEGAVRQPVVAGRVRQSHLHQHGGRRPRPHPGAPGRPRRRHRQAGLGAALQRLPQRRAAASRRRGPRPPSIRPPATSTCSRSARSCSACRRTASRCGIARCPRTSAPSPRTAAAPRRRSSRAISSSSTRWSWRGAISTARGNRYFAFDKRTGQTVWVSSPQSRHYDTNYSTPIVVDLPTGRALIVGGTDGAYHALRVNTGEKIWSIEVSKRAILNSAIVRDNVAYITHGEENMDTTEMGMIAAVDATKTGALTADAFKWKAHGFLPTFASPVMDAERLYTDGQRRHPRRLRPEDRRAAVDQDAGHDAEGVAGAGRRQALRRHRERQVLHPEAVGAGRRGARRGRARHRRRAGGDRRVADRRRRPHLRRVDGQPLRDRASGRPASHGSHAGGRRRGSGRPPAAVGPGVPVRRAARARRQAGLHAPAVRREGRVHPRGARR